MKTTTGAPPASDGPAVARRDDGERDFALVPGDVLEPRRLPEPSRWPPIVLGDCLALVVSILISLPLVTRLLPSRDRASIPQAFVVIPMFVLAFAIHGLYRSRQRLVQSLFSDVVAVGKALATGVLLALALDSALGAFRGRSLTLTQGCAIALAALILVPLARSGVRYLVARRMSSVPTKVIIAGSGQVAARVADRLSRCGEVNLVGMVDDDPLEAEVLGGFSELARLCQEHHADHVLVCFSRTPSHELLTQLRDLVAPTRISVVPRFYELVNWRSGIEELHGIPLLHVAPPQLSTLARSTKRAVDIVGSTLAIVVLSPILIGAALAIKVSSRGPVFFQQLRGGAGGRPFEILKFRTMENDAEAQREALEHCNDVDGPIFKIRDDPRVTSVGAFLRRASLDELPQLFNVLAGQMSLVGPRPFPIKESEQLKGSLARRFNVLPGMTGLWQVCGRSDLSFEDLCHLDTVYVTSWSLSWDLRILLQTPASVFLKRGAF